MQFYGYAKKTKLFLSSNFEAYEACTDLKINKNSVTRLINLMRSNLKKHILDQSLKLGGKDKIVECDEAKFGRRKHHRGRLVNG